MGVSVWRRVQGQHKTTPVAAAKRWASAPSQPRDGPQGWSQMLPESDIDHCVRFSLGRCVYSVIALVLLASDIPRTGLSIYSVWVRLQPTWSPGGIALFGPYDYPTLHVTKDLNSTNLTSSTTVLGYSSMLRTSPISATAIWAYKYDSMSVCLRAAAELLNVSEYPPCLLYKSPCDTDVMPLAAAFAMLDSLIQAIADRESNCERSVNVSSTCPLRRRAPTFLFEVLSAWVDRLYHYVYRVIYIEKRRRVVNVDYFAKQSTAVEEDLGLCATARGHGALSYQRPKFCDHRVSWKTRHPLNANGLPLLSVNDQLVTRVRYLQTQHPSLYLDVTVIYTDFTLESARAWSMHHRRQTNEIHTFTRGRQCSDDGRQCTTALIDDYRYERATLETNAAEVHPIVVLLRSVAQIYVWIRLGFLIVGCYLADSRAQATQRRDMDQTGRYHANFAQGAVACRRLQQLVAGALLRRAVLSGMRHFAARIRRQVVVVRRQVRLQHRRFRDQRMHRDAQRLGARVGSESAGVCHHPTPRPHAACMAGQERCPRCSWSHHRHGVHAYNLGSITKPLIPRFPCSGDRAESTEPHHRHHPSRPLPSQELGRARLHQRSQNDRARGRRVVAHQTAAADPRCTHRHRCHSNSDAALFRMLAVACDGVGCGVAVDARGCSTAIDGRRTDADAGEQVRQQEITRGRSGHSNAHTRTSLAHSIDERGHHDRSHHVRTAALARDRTVCVRIQTRRRSADEWTTCDLFAPILNQRPGREHRQRCYVEKSSTDRQIEHCRRRLEYARAVRIAQHIKRATDLLTRQIPILSRHTTGSPVDPIATIMRRHQINQEVS